MNRHHPGLNRQVAVDGPILPGDAHIPRLKIWSDQDSNDMQMRTSEWSCKTYWYIYVYIYTITYNIIYIYTPFIYLNIYI